MTRIITIDLRVFQVYKKEFTGMKMLSAKPEIGHKLGRLSPLTSIEEIFTGDCCTSEARGSGSSD